MIEFSFAEWALLTELALLIWAVAATAVAFEFKHRNHMVAIFIAKLLDDAAFYAEYHDKFKAQQKRRGEA
jgi:hypothetical protein